MQGDAGIVTPEMWFLGRHPVELTDGSHLAALNKADEVAANARYAELPLSHIRAQGAARDFQIAAYGENERGISLGERIVYPDGSTGQYGALSDAKYSTQGRSWYVPDSLNSRGIAAIATKRMGRALVRFAEAADAFGENGVIEITTNNPQAATVFEARMSALGIRGYARLIPPGAP